MSRGVTCGIVLTAGLLSVPVMASGLVAGRATPWPDGVLPGRAEQSNGRHVMRAPFTARRSQALVMTPRPVEIRVRHLDDDRSGLRPLEESLFMAFVEKERFPSAMARKTYHYLVNEIWNELREHTGNPVDLARHFARTASGNSDDVIRDYALQHLAAMKEKHVLSIQLEALAAALNEDGVPLAGTTLIGLRSISEQSADPRALERIRDKVPHIIKSQEAPETARITAFALAGELRIQEIMPEAFQVIEDESSSTPLRLAAMRAIGEIGRKEDLDKLLNSETAGWNPLIHRELRKIALSIDSTAQTRPSNP